MSAEPLRLEPRPAVRLQMGTVVTHRLFNDWLGVVLEGNGDGRWWVWWGSGARLADPDDLLQIPMSLVDLTDEQLLGELARRGRWILDPPETASDPQLAFSALDGGDVGLHLEGEAAMLRGVPCRLSRETAEAMLADLLAILRGG